MKRKECGENAEAGGFLSLELYHDATKQFYPLGHVICI
jgi:hypothetical protein